MSPNHDPAMQIDALRKSGCDKVYQEKEGCFKDRPEFEKMNRQLQYGDTVIVWRLDRIGKSLADLKHLMDSFKERGIHFASLKENIDTGTSQGRYFFRLLTSIYNFEKEITSEKTVAGLKDAGKRGRKGGRPGGLSEAALDKAEKAGRLYKEGELPVADIARSLEIGKTTLYRYLHYHSPEIVNKRITGIKITDKKVYHSGIRKDLFRKLVGSNAFWSYSKISYEKITDDILIEKVMECLDIEDIRKLFELYSRNHLRRVWKNELVIQDPYFRSLNILLAKLFFNISKPEQYISRVQKEYQKSITGSWTE